MKASHHPARFTLRTFILPSAICLLPFLSACTDAYRADDWEDVFTGTVGEGYGIKARVGPFQTGIYTGNDMAGLRSGVSGENWGRIANYDHYWLFYGKEHFDGWMDSRGPVARNKVVAAEHLFPCFVWSEAVSPYAKEDPLTGEPALTDGSKNAAYWTQLEIAVGLGGTVRLGFNPGELLDALLGHVGIDIYGDDVSPEEATRLRQRRRTELDNPILKLPGTLPIHPEKKPEE